MADHSFLDWPFLSEAHHDLAGHVRGFAEESFGSGGFLHHGDIDAECRDILAGLADAGITRYAVPVAYGGATETLDVRSLCLVREHLAYRSGLADFVFAMQGLGSGTISLFGSDAQKSAYLPDVAAGKKIAAFALTEPDAGSDVSALALSAQRDGDGFVLNGEKTFISNGGIADFYVVFARTGEAPGARGISAFIVDADNPGLKTAERIETIAPHPLARLAFTDCHVDEDALIGEAGSGFKYAMSTLDVFRSTVAAAALGFARRALDEALGRAQSRQLFGGTLSDLQGVQSQLADMALNIDASALLIYRAAWAKDSGAPRVTREAAMAKLFSTETAQTAIDTAVQIFGGLGVTKGSVPEALYREIRALRIYEGASEVQKLVIAKQILGGG
ncbi:acyl-CoA dehydrogenase family protein [Hyphobacterium marinum]|uniref:Acyl-CoA dehydrogenase family protein n=1 Tax=Hyphobacterium marinum TaxID=3116574 RepID=A0ABU7LYJ0_9PROT|nr:acyl-CoA dehydrogenase family protein [Hyphobacterium sp. Y6023]MEE2566614.1 acyl-CoA dehydrogenase family protein [Hyphobacterium sp. Y6023]